MILTVGRVVGIYSGLDRDPRLHSLCVAIEARVVPGQADLNPLEIMEVIQIASALGAHAFEYALPALREARNMGGA